MSIELQSDYELPPIKDIKRTADMDAVMAFVDDLVAVLLLIGPAGTGKSVILQTIVHNLPHANVAVAATTGMAAAAVGGITIHRLFGLRAELVTREMLKRYRPPEILAKLDVLIIDEISMCRADLMYAIDYALKLARGNDLPFGGCRVIFIGDHKQLLPILKDAEAPAYANLSHVKNKGIMFWQTKIWPAQGDFTHYELQTIHRQDNPIFIDLLGRVRDGRVTAEDLSILNSRVGAPPAGSMILTPYNKVADNYNADALKRLPGSPDIFKPTVEGDAKLSDFRLDAHLVLKRGAK